MEATMPSEGKSKRGRKRKNQLLRKPIRTQEDFDLLTERLMLDLHEGELEGPRPLSVRTGIPEVKAETANRQAIWSTPLGRYIKDNCPAEYLLILQCYTQKSSFPKSGVSSIIYASPNPLFKTREFHDAYMAYMRISKAKRKEADIEPTTKPRRRRRTSDTVPGTRGSAPSAQGARRGSGGSIPASSRGAGGSSPAYRTK